MKKIIAIFSVMLLLSAAVKIAFLNMNAERPNIQEFEMGTEVFYEDNYLLSRFWNCIAYCFNSSFIKR